MRYLNESFNNPYYNKNGLLDRVVYLNFKGNHTPIETTDYMSWFLIGVIVIILAMALYAGAFSNVIADRQHGSKKAQ